MRVSLGFGDKYDIDGVATEHIRLSLLKLLVQIQGTDDRSILEANVRSMIDQIDSLRLAFDLSRKQIMLPLEPVNVAELATSVVYKISKKNGIALSNISFGALHKSPVLAHKTTLARSLEAMLYAAANSSIYGIKNQLSISAVKYKEGIKLGVYAEGAGLDNALNSSHKISSGKYSTERSTLKPSVAAHLYVADVLLGAMGAEFRLAKHKNNIGVATVLPFSSQLQLVI